MSQFRQALAALVFGAGFAVVSAQTVTLTGNFTGTALDSGWTVGGTGYTPSLTAPSVDTAGNGWLRLTSAGTYQATYALNTNSFISKNATITASFNYVAYGGTGADGITFFLADGSVPFAVGAYGGSLGYAQNDTLNGMNGGYIGLGIDEYGNYANNSESRVGGYDTNPGTLTLDAVSVRGPGNGTTGYAYLGGTGTLPVSLDTPGNATMTRPVATTFQIIITATNQLTVYMDRGATGNFTSLYSIDLSGYARPETLVMGFTGSTGAATNIHEVRAVNLSSVVANLWTNAAGDSNWGTDNSWWGDPSGRVPETFADVLLDNSYVSTAQTINVGTNRTLRSLQIDAPFTYTLNNGTLTFDRGGVAGPSGIFVSQTRGSATQTINSALVLNNDIQIQNNSSGALNLGGSVSLGNRSVEFNGTGATTSTGIVSGTGALVQSGAGTTTLGGNNTYSGGTTISAGTLNANSNTALGNGSVTLAGGTLGSTNSSTVANTITLTGSAGLSGITTAGALTQNGGNYTLRMANATQSGAVNLSNNSTARTLTVQVDSGNSTISGVIANGGGSAGSGLTKTGAGTLVLSGANTYTGATTISAGTVRLGADNVLADASTLNLAGGSLNLAGFSDKVGNLTFSNGASIDFGTAAGNNSFVFGNLTPAPTGVLTINNYVGPDSSNWTGAGDYLGSTTAGLSSTLLNQIYFSGYGTGSLQNVSLTDAGNSLGQAYRIAPTAITWGNYTWTSNSNQQWGNATNWQGGVAPPNAANPTNVFVSFGTGTQATVSANTSSTINALRFSSNAIAYNISGNATLTFQNGAGVAFVQQQSANNQILSPASIVLRNNMVFDVTGAGNLTVGAAISDGNSTLSVTKTGSGGTLILTGANTYKGGTSIQTGALQAQNTTALGTGAVTVFDGAALNLAGGIAPSNNMTLTGTGVGGNGALRNVSGNNTVSGTLTEGAATRIQSDAGLLTLSGTLTGNATATTFGGSGNTTVSGIITTGAGTVTKEGSGTLTFSGGSANTYTGATIVDAGTLNLSKTANVNSVRGELVVNAGTVNQTTSGQLLNTGTVTLNGGTYNLEGAGSVTQTVQTLNTAAGSIVNLGTADTLTVSGAGVSTVNGRITGPGALATAGTGTVFLGGNNTYSGGTTIGSVATAANNNALGTGGVTVSSGGNLQIQGGVTLANAMTLSGPGTNANDGAIENFSGNNQLAGNITLAAASRIQSSSGNLTISGNISGTNQTLTLGGASNTAISGAITTGTGGLVKDGTGVVTLSGATANTFTGNTTVTAGTLNLSKNSGVVAIGGNLSISGGTVNQNASGQLATTSNVSVTGGAFNLANNATQTIATLNTSAGTTFDLGSSSALTVGGAGNGTVTGAITGSGAFTKSGAGTLTFNGTAANTYTGVTTVNNGTLNLSKSANVVSVVGNLAIGGGTVNQTTSGQLSSASAVTITSGSYNLGNATTQTVSALNTLSGTTVSLGTSSTLTLAGSSNNTIAGVISGAGSLTQTGTGTTTLSGANTYTGTTTVGAGTLRLGASSRLADASTLNIAGGTFDLNGFSERVGTLNFSNGGTLDFGTAGNNSFIFSNLDLSASGLLTINNYVGPTVTSASDGAFANSGDFIGSTTALTGGQLGQIYFYGYGSGSFQNNTLRSDGNGLGGSTSYRIAPGAYTVWDGLRNNGNNTGDALWSTSRNWVGDNLNSFTSTTRLSFGTSNVPADRQTSDMDGSRTVNSIRFDDVGIGFTLSGTNASSNVTLTMDGTLPSLVQVSATNQTMTMDRISWASDGVIEVSKAGNLNLGNSTTGGALYGGGNITKVGTGSGRLVLNANNSNWTGALTVAEGIVEARNANALGSTSAGTTVNSGGSLYLGAGNFTFAENLTLSGSGYNGTGALRTLGTNGTTTVSGTIALPATATINTDAGGTLALNGQISGAGGLTKAGNGTLTLGAANTYTGATTLSAGTTRLGVANAFQNSSAITIQTGAVLDLNGFDQMVTNLQAGAGGNAGGTIEFNNSTLTLTSGVSSFGGDFGTSNGTIVVNAGATLTLTDSFDAANINIILNGGTLNLGSGLTHTFNNLTVTGAGTSVIDFGTSGSTVAEFNSVNVTGAGSLSVTNWTDLVDYFLAQNSTGAQGTAPNTKIVFSGFSGNDTRWLPFYGGPKGQITPVPEPSSYGAMLLGASAMLVLHRRMRRRA